MKLTLAAAASLSIVGISGFSSVAEAQMGELLQRKCDILQQQADAETVRAEAARSQAEAQAQAARTATSINTGSTYTPPQPPTFINRPLGTNDVLAGSHSPTCTLGNGVHIATSTSTLNGGDCRSR
ncbi:hypothetical protein [Novosphingobium album (ex Liu et al. 2023)]|uniref:Uncharacterized protein n=1 Tax=Novosphingobium album (ex Liu et al. 2023) TaxID=3031130 RepID=A0ABT5WNW8_9SPHN|nr:hypothetical protein [Novosphingobium album (ex Liu et al. 2023)]MDE8651431.1 hypothetical protein [Novosphingobium album (ex Liu et al. 2023)]